MAKQRQVPNNRKDLIIAAAQTVIATHGYPAASARTISAQCGISPGTLTYHFATMDELLVSALRDASSHFTAEIVSASLKRRCSVRRLQYIVEAMLPSSPSAIRNWKLWLEYWARAAHMPELAILHCERYADLRNAFETIIHEGIASGEIKKLDARLEALKLIGLLDGLGLQAVIGDREITIGVARKMLLQAIGNLRPEKNRLPDRMSQCHLR